MAAWTIYLTFLGLAVLLGLPLRDSKWPRLIALGTAILGFVAGVIAITGAADGQLHTITRISWIPLLGITFHLAADGISLVLVLLTGIAAIAGVLFSWNVQHRPREFFAFYLALIGAVYGVFLSFDLFLLFVFYELAIIPKYFLISIWGSTRREYGAMKLALYSFVGSAFVLIGIIAAYVTAGASTTNLVELAHFPFPDSFQMWALPVVFVGFGILAGLWPFHTWAPTGHVAAPTSASMLLAGVIMKLGAYGCLRVALTLFPHGMNPWTLDGFSAGLWHSLQAHSLVQNLQWLLHFLGFTSWKDFLGALAVIGIVYGAMVALVQKDFKFVIGYSSVSHMGFVLLGLVTLTETGLRGSVLQMFSHGIIAGLLFAVVGRMVYERTHTRDLEELSEMRLSRLLPFAAVTFTIAGMASMGLPGFSGFIAEFQVLLGAWQASPTLALIAGLGIIIGVAYTLRALQLAFFTEDTLVPVNASTALAPRVLSAITLPERAGAAFLIAVSLVVGLFPGPLINLIVSSFSSPLFDWLRSVPGP